MQMCHSLWCSTVVISRPERDCPNWTPSTATPVLVFSPKLSPVGWGWYLWMGDHLVKFSVLCSLEIKHAFHLYNKCCMWVEFQSISNCLPGFSQRTPVSTLLKIDSQSSPSGCGAVLRCLLYTSPSPRDA